MSIQFLIKIAFNFQINLHDSNKFNLSFRKVMTNLFNQCDGTRTLVKQKSLNNNNIILSNINIHTDVELI